MKQYLLTILSCFIPGLLFASQLLTVAEKAAQSEDLVILNKLKPRYILEDLDGDAKKDVVLFVEDKKSKKQGVCILHSDSRKCVILGAGKKFYAGGDNFRWVDTWQIIPKGETWEATFKPDGDVLGERQVLLENKSLKLCVDEGGCGVISYKKGKYIWVHQSD